MAMRDELFWGRQKPDVGYVHSFTISRHLAGKGTGVKVLDEIERICSENGKTFLRLDCSVGVRRLRQYYEEYGFIEVDTTTIWSEESVSQRKNKA